MSSLARTEIDGVIRRTLEDRNIVFSRVGDSGYDLTLENTKHLASAVRLLVGDKSLLVEAFFVRRPDDNAAEFYRFLLERNGRMYAVDFSLDPVGDVYLTGKLPLSSVGEQDIDRLLLGGGGLGSLLGEGGEDLDVEAGGDTHQHDLGDADVLDLAADIIERLGGKIGYPERLIIQIGHGRSF